MLQPQQSLRASSGAVAKDSAKSSKESKTKSSLFPFWLVLVVIYHARRFIQNRREAYSYDITYDDDFFMESGLNENLQYGLEMECEDDFLSVDGSDYGSTAHWNGDTSYDKFNLPPHIEDLLNV